MSSLTQCEKRTWCVHTYISTCVSNLSAPPTLSTTLFVLLLLVLPHFHRCRKSACWKKRRCSAAYPSRASCASPAWTPCRVTTTWCWRCVVELVVRSSSTYESASLVASLAGKSTTYGCTAISCVVMGGRNFHRFRFTLLFPPARAATKAFESYLWSAAILLF